MLDRSARLALGYTAMLVHACTHWRGFDVPAVRSALARQIHLTGVQALPVVALAALLFGAVVPAQAVAWLGPENPIVLKTLIWGGIRELGPLVAAGVVIVRSSVAMAAEVALMRLHDEVPISMREGLLQEEEIALPRVLGTAVSGAMLVAYFQVMAIGAALLASAWLLGTPLLEETETLLGAGVWWQVPLSMGKGALFGIGIGAVACHHGAHAQWTLAAVPKAAVAAGVGSVVFVMLVQAASVALHWL